MEHAATLATMKQVENAEHNFRVRKCDLLPFGTFVSYHRLIGEKRKPTEERYDDGIYVGMNHTVPKGSQVWMVKSQKKNENEEVKSFLPKRTNLLSGG